MSLPVQICSVSQNWHHVGLLYSISEVINRHADLIKNLMLSCLNFQSRVGQYTVYIGKNKNDYSSISFCVYSKWMEAITYSQNGHQESLGKIFFSLQM